MFIKRFEDFSKSDKVNEGFFKDLINQLFTGSNTKNTKPQIDKIKDILTKKELLTDNIESLIGEIISHKNSKLINFETLSRTVSNVLMKKGDGIKNLSKYFIKLLKSLDEREKIKDKFPEEDYIDDNDNKEVSEIPRKEFMKEKKLLQVELLKMQEWLKENNKSVVVVFEGRDTAGKGSTIKQFTEYLDPKFFEVVTKGIPTEEERNNWFKRYEKDIEPGKIIFFDRSWYNRGVVEPVMGYSSYEEYESFMANVNNFEKKIVDNGNYLIKFWLSITKETQLNRFDIRKESPLKYWKFSPNDAKAQDKWDEYTSYKQRMFKVTSTDHAPWTVIDSNDKRVSGLNAMRYVLSKTPYDGKNKEIIEVDYPESITTIK